MGQGFGVKCKKCGYGFDACLGFGMLFPDVYQENVKKMKSGELGEEAKKFFDEHPNGVINSEQVVAKCRNCGNYDVVDDLTMYVPKAGVMPLTEEQIKDIGYFVESDIKKSYVKFMDYPHKCSQCGGKSKVYKSFIKKAMKAELKCPKCEGAMGLDPERMIIMWD